jgi:hypothetical protein
VQEERGDAGRIADLLDVELMTGAYVDAMRGVRLDRRVRRA